MKQYFVIAVLVFASVLVSGCQKESPVGTPQAPAVKEKQGETTKTGLVIENSGTFVLQVVGEPPTAIDSYGVELKNYVGQTVTVTGQYSGDTLFVGEIK